MPVPPVALLLFPAREPTLGGTLLGAGGSDAAVSPTSSPCAALSVAFNAGSSASHVRSSKRAQTLSNVGENVVVECTGPVLNSANR